MWAAVVQPHGGITASANGDRPLHRCATHELVAITNTTFPLKESDITTWTHHRGEHKHLLHYVIQRQRNLGEVRIMRVMLNATRPQVV